MHSIGNKPFGSGAVNNATSGHSDSWRTPCRALLLSQMKWATCVLQVKQVLYLTHRDTLHSVNKNIPEMAREVLFTLFFSSYLQYSHSHFGAWCCCSHKYSSKYSP